MLQNLQAILKFKTLAYILKLFCNSDEKKQPCYIVTVLKKKKKMTTWWKRSIKLLSYNGINLTGK